MATTIRIAPTQLSVGQKATVTWTPATEPIALGIQAVQVGTAASQVRLIVRDSRGLTLASSILNGSDVSMVDPLEGVVGSLTGEIVCMKGVAVVLLGDLTGATAFGGTIQTADLSDGVLSANAEGHLKMADDYFTAAEFVAGAGGKFAPNCLIAAGIQNLFADDAFTAAEFVAAAGGKFAPNCLVTAGIQNLFADDSFTAAEFAAAGGGKFAPNCLTAATAANLFANDSMDAAFCAAKIDAGAIPAAAIGAGVLLGLETVIADPGAGGAIIVAVSGHCLINFAGGPFTRTLAIPAASGEAILLVHEAGANAGTVTVAAPIDVLGTTVINFGAQLGQWVLLVGMDIGAGLQWRVASQGSGVTNGIPPYGPIAIPDPGAGAAIAAIASGRCIFTIAVAGDNRTLAAPVFEGQTLVLESLAGSARGIVTIATGFNDAAALILHFRGGVNERVWLFADLIAGALRWRVGNQDARTHVARNLLDPGNVGDIEVLHDDGYMPMDILGAGHNRNLAIPTYVGQRLTIIHDATANAGTVTSAQDITDVGGQNVIQFTAALGEMIVLEGVNFGVGLRWRVLSNPDGLVIN